MSRWTCGLLMLVGATAIGGSGTPVFASVRYYGGSWMARQMYQNQMKQQAAMQKAMIEADQKATAAQLAQEKKEAEEHAKLVRMRREKSAQKKEEATAKRKAANAAAAAKAAAAEKASTPKEPVSDAPPATK